jgi:hypothetical protein
VTERRRAAALAAALKAMFRKLEQRETPQALRAAVDQLEAAEDAGEAGAGESQADARDRKRRRRR